MKIISIIILAFPAVLIMSGCSGNSSRKGAAIALADTVTVPDTGYTGIKKYFSNNLLVKEVTFNNGVREGEMKSYYQGGQLYQRFWYENGLREDSAVWYYLEGQVFRTTPYVHDTIEGVQKQYYRTGGLRARLYYRKGLRTPALEEFDLSGRRITDYPGIVYKIDDSYASNGKVRIDLGLSKKEIIRVRFYRGEFTGGLFDTTRCERLKTINGSTSVELRKTNGVRNNYISVIAAVLTNFGNTYLTSRKIELPYADLN